MEVNNTAPSGHDVTGFFYGYVIVIAAFCLQALGIGIFNSLGVFVKPLMTEFGWSRAAIAGALSLAYTFSSTASILLGGLNDRFGPRLIMTGSGFILGAGYMLLSRVDALYSYYLYCCLFVGIGLSGTDIVLLSTLARWFVKKRGMMTGLVKVGTGSGMLVMPIFMTWFMTIYGWRTTLLIIGAICLVFFIILSQLLVRDPFKKGLLPDGSKNRNPLKGTAPEKGLTLSRALRTRQFWTICFNYFAIFFCASTILLHIVPHAIDLGITPSSAAKVLSTLGALSIAGRFFMGASGDRIGNRYALLICFVCMLAGLIWLQVSDSLWMLILFSIIHGFAHGGFFAVVSPVLAEFFGTRSHGIIYGIITFVSALGGALGSIIAGYVFDVTGSYGTIFLVLTGMTLAGLIATISLRPVAGDSGLSLTP